MDRRSFINRDQLNNTGSCQLENCKCGETVLAKRRQFEKIRPLHLVAITITAFVFATVFLIAKIEAAKANMEAIIRLKKENTLHCSLDRIRKLDNDQQPANRNSGNSCPHQLSESALLIISDHKRKKNHNC